jgi:hypothetical protein
VHKRKEIRKYVIELLKKIPNLSCKHIHQNRPNPVLLEEVPAIFVYFGKETNKVIVGNERSPKVYERTAPINIDIITTFSENMEDFLDDETKKVEIALHNATDIPDYMNDFYLSDTTPYEADNGVDTTWYGAQMTFQVINITDLHLTEKPNDFSEYSVDIEDGEARISAEGKI